MTTGLVDKFGGFLSLTLCNEANFDSVLLIKYDVVQKCLNVK